MNGLLHPTSELAIHHGAIARARAEADGSQVHVFGVPDRCLAPDEALCPRARGEHVVVFHVLTSYCALRRALWCAGCGQR